MSLPFFSRVRHYRDSYDHDVARPSIDCSLSLSLSLSSPHPRLATFLSATVTAGVSLADASAALPTERARRGRNGAGPNRDPAPLVAEY